MSWSASPCPSLRLVGSPFLLSVTAEEHVLCEGSEVVPTYYGQLNSSTSTASRDRTL